MYKKMNNNEEILLKQIFTKPTYKFHIRELAKATKLNPNTIINISEKLIKESILVKEKKKHITEIFFNFENKDAVIKKRIFNLSQIYKSGLVDFLAKECSPKAISIIGSYSKGEDIEKSDIDIVVVSEKEKSINMERFEKLLSRKIHLIITNYKKMSEEFYINLINGMILYGYIDKK